MMNKKKKGSLTVVGTGINALAHCSIEARSFIEHADVVFALVTDPLTMDWLKELNSNTINLRSYYQFIEDRDKQDPDVARPRIDTYEAIKNTLCQAVYESNHVVAVFYGHPGVFVYPSHAAIKQLKSEGFRATMLPGISAEDCLFADLGVDPCTAGCAQYEATSFLFYKNNLDVTAGLILWQLGVLGDHTLQRLRPADSALSLFTKKLLSYYPANHQIAIYEACNLPIGNPRIDWIKLIDLSNATVGLATTIYIPPLSVAEVDLAFLEQLDLTSDDISKHLATTAKGR